MHRGVTIALVIIFTWLVSTGFLLAGFTVNWYSPWPYLLVFWQMHLYTGLFITAHDAMHGIVSPQKPAINHLIGRACALLFAYNFYGNLYQKHHLHHAKVGTEADPDYHPGNPALWYIKFVFQYVNIWQIVLMAGTYHLLRFFFPTENVVLFWMVPAILSTLQLFIFGTYLPHRGKHAPENIHKARSQSLNHWLAFITCYFFGYHYEHHASPGTPWWKLYAVKETLEKKRSLK